MLQQHSEAPARFHDIERKGTGGASGIHQALGGPGAPGSHLPVTCSSNPPIATMMPISDGRYDQQNSNGVGVGGTGGSVNLQKQAITPGAGFVTERKNHPIPQMMANRPPSHSLSSKPQTMSKSS